MPEFDEEMTMKKYKDKNWLKRKYHDELKTQKEMAKEANCHRKTISKWLHKFNLNNPKIQYERQKGKNHPRWLGKQKDYICPICGQQFRAYHNNPKYCSVTCKAKAQRKEKKTLVCDYCGEQYQVHPSVVKWNRIRNRTKNFCSSECRNAFFTGKNNSQWVQDRSKLKCRPNKLKKHKQWRRKIFERDNHTCILCGERGGYLEPHHIKRWADYPDLRYEVINGITLCYDCHREVTGHEEDYENRFQEYLESLDR